MKYKNRLIFPTVVTLSLLGLSTDANADEHNDIPPPLETIHSTNEESISNSTESTKSSNTHETEPITALDKSNDTQNQVSNSEYDEKGNIIHNSEAQNHSNDASNINSEKDSEKLLNNTEASLDVEEATSEENNTEETQTNYPDEEAQPDSEINNTNENDDAIEIEKNTSKMDESEDENTSIEKTELKTEKNLDTQHNSMNTEKNTIEKSQKNHLDEDKKGTPANNDFNKDLSSDEKDNKTRHENIPGEKAQLDNEINNTNENDEVAAENKKNASKMNEFEDVPKSTEKSEIKSEKNLDTQYNSKDKKEDINKNESEDEEVSLESKAKVFGMRTFMLPDSATLKTETFKKSVDAPPQYDDAYYAARVAAGPNSGRYSPVTSEDSKSLGWLEHRTLFITKKASYDGTTFYRVHSGFEKNMQGWVKEEDLKLFNLSKPVKHNKTYDIKLDKMHLLTDPWGTETQQIKRLDKYDNKPFRAEKEVNLGAHTYYYGKIGNDSGWLEKSRLSDSYEKPIYNNIEIAARVKDGPNSGRYSPVTSENSKSLGWLAHRTLFITQEAKYRGENFYKIHSGYNGNLQGWIKEKDLRLFNTSKPKSHINNYKVKIKSDYLLTDPWGTATQRIKKLSSYGNSIFQSEKSMELGAHTYYYGKIGNDYGWLQDNRVETYKPVVPSPSIKTVRHSQSLAQAVNTQMNLSSKPQAWANGGGWRNATRNEVTRFLDTSHQSSDTWMYTFLDLDRSQNIASSTINSKLLSGKGTLNNKGSAFLNASKAHGINEVYLISHAIHETGNGTSTLAQGVKLDSNGNSSSNGKKYYNMYGIGAYDYSPVLAGARYAQQMGWDTPEKAIVGGAQFISQSYFNRGQTNLYAMRWNPLNPGTYQYATDVNWAYATARNLESYYNQLGIKGRYYTRYTF